MLKKLCGSREGTGNKILSLPTSFLLAGVFHCLNPELGFKVAQKMQSAGVGLLGHRAGQKGAENGFGKM